MEHFESQLTATQIDLADDILDAIDAIVAPGVTLNPADDGWVPPARPRTRRPPALTPEEERTMETLPSRRPAKDRPRPSPATCGSTRSHAASHRRS
jgi:hypothetical protein